MSDLTNIVMSHESTFIVSKSCKVRIHFSILSHSEEKVDFGCNHNSSDCSDAWRASVAEGGRDEEGNPLFTF